MSFRVTRQKAILASGFRDALRGQLERAIKELDVSSRVSRAARIHRARSRVKKVRSALLLLESVSFPGVTRTDHDLLRDATAEIAAARNADANIKALKKICELSETDPLRFSKAFTMLEKQRQAVARGTSASMRKAATLLKGASARIEAWDDRAILWKDVTRGAGRLYKRGRTAFRKASADPSPEALHEWRKRAKEALHGLQLISTRESPQGRRGVHRMKKLCALLGAAHDLAILCETLGEFHIGREKDLAGKLTASHREKMQARAFKLGAKCFLRKPAEFVKRMEA